MKNKSYILLLFFLSTQIILFGQSKEIKGKVISAEDQSDIIGATIEVKDDPNSLGTITEYDGTYSITVPSKESILVFSYLGMKTQEVKVGDQNEIVIVMDLETSLMEEIVIVGYGTEKRSKISGAVSVINADEISETPILRTEQALQGRTSGVQVTQNSGSPGSALTVRIRGNGTINGGDPLYIVDGIQVSGLDFLSPSDIASINILKDAASSAIYGSRGANGVVLITTKTGKKNQEGKISYDGYFGVQSPWKKMHLLNAREYAIIQNEAYIAAGKAPPKEFLNPNAFGEGTRWQDEIFETAPIMNHQISLRGGSKKSTYAISGNYFKQDGIVGGAKSNFERVTARLNTTHDLKEWLTLGNTLGVTHFTRNALPENSEFNTPLLRALNMDPVTPVRKFDGTYAYSPYSDTDITNPVNQIEQTFDTWKSNRLLGSIYTDIKFTDEISLKTVYSLDVTFATQDIFLPRFDLSYDPVLSDAPAQEKRLENSVIYNNYNWSNWQLENLLSYKKNFNDKHNVSIILGNTVLENNYHFTGAANSNLPSNDPDDAFISNTIDPIETQTASEEATSSSLLSYFGRVNYELDGKYLFSGTLRADGSSKFGANNRFGYFPSLSAGWIISNESFFEVDLISLLKFRASWGKNGNDNIGNYRFSTVVRPGQNYTYGPDETITSGSVATVAANPDLKWETITQTNIGFDVELWSGKLNFTTDYYVKNTDDVLYAAPIPFTSGTDAPIQNIASVRNSGLEFSVLYREKEKRVNYSIGGNISFVSSKVTGLGEGGEPVFAGSIQSANSFVTRTDIGDPVASFYGYVTDGIFQTQAEVEAHAFQNENTAAGDIRFKDLNGDGVINEEDREVIGNPTPDFTYGINFNLDYKGFDLGLFFQGVHGNDLYNGTVRYDFNYVNRPISVLDRWTGAGTSNDEPRVNISDPNQNARISDRFVENGSYLRLKNFQIGYNIPKKLLSKFRLDKCRIYISSQNLLTFTNYSGLDPEIGSIGNLDDPDSNTNYLEVGIDRGFYPQSRTVLGGLQITF